MPQGDVYIYPVCGMYSLRWVKDVKIPSGIIVYYK